MFYSAVVHTERSSTRQSDLLSKATRMLPMQLTLMFARRSLRLVNIHTRLAQGLAVPAAAVVDAQNSLTERVFTECDTRGRFAKLMTALYDYPHYGAPFRRGSRCYNHPLCSAQPLLKYTYVRQAAHVSRL